MSTYFANMTYCSEANAYDLDKFFQEKNVMKSKDNPFTRNDFNKSLEDFDFNVRIINALKSQDIRSVGELLQMSLDHFKYFRNFGDISKKEVFQFIEKNYPLIGIGGLNHLMTLFWNFRDMYSLPFDTPKPKKPMELNINGYSIPINPSASVLLVEKVNQEDQHSEMVMLHRIYQNGKREKTPLNVRLLLGMTAQQFIQQFNHQCNAKWMEQLKNTNK